MDPTTLLNRPKISNITPKITKISNLTIASGQARKSSTKLVKVFEKGTYQKKTQLSVLNRYKRRLDSIQKQNDRAFARKQKVKIKLPDIKKYTGNLFTAGSTNDPFKAIGALAAFNSFQKGSRGDWGGALGSGLIAFGLLGGGALGIRAARNMARGGAAKGSGTVVTPPWWEKNPRSLSRSNESYGRYIAGEANIGDRARLARRGLIPASGMFSRGGTEALERQAGKPLAKTALKRFGGAILPGIGAAFSFQSAKERDKTGDKFGSAVDNISGSLNAFAAGVQLYAGASAATGLGLPVAGFIELAAGIAEVGAFTLDMFNLARDITGQSDKESEKNRLKQQTEQQKALVEKKGDEKNKLTFSKTLNSYDKAVTKFEEFSKGFTTNRAKSSYVEGAEPPAPPPPPGQSVKINSQVVQDAVDFRSQFPLGRGTPNSSATPYELQMRENTMLYSAGIGNDPTVESVHASGSAHYSNTATDIPVNSRQVGDRVAQFWRSRGYSVLWQVPGHYDHVHVQWNEGSSQAGPPTTQNPQGNPNVFNLELHADPAASGKKTGLIASYIDPETGMSRSLKNAFGFYDRNFRNGDLGGPRRGLNLLESDMSKGVDANAQRIFEMIKANPNQQVNLFAGHNDVTTGETGAAGERNYTKKLAEKVMSLARAANLKNVTYYPSIIANDPNDPNANWNRAAALRGSRNVRSPQRPLRQIQQYPSYDARSQRQQVIPVPYPVVRQQQAAASAPSAPMMMSGPSEQQLLNSFYKRVLLNTVQ